MTVRDIDGIGNAQIEKVRGKDLFHLIVSDVSDIAILTLNEARLEELKVLVELRLEELRRYKK